MKVCGFSFIRNGVRLGYPFEESIRSVLPLCDAFYIAVGRSDDDTLNRVRSLDPKIVVVETVWDDSLKTGGAVLADETNKAFRAIPADYDWAFYIQGDELIHEKDVPAIRSALEQYLPDKQVDGLLGDRKFDLIYFSTTQFPVCVLGGYWKKKWGIPYVIDIQDMWHSDYYKSKPRSEQPPKYWLSYRVNKYLEKIAMRQAGGLIYVSQKYQDILAERYPHLQSIPHRTLTFGVSDTDFSITRNHSEISPAFKVDDSCIHLVFTGRGGHDIADSLKLLFTAFKKLLEKNPDAEKLRFHFIGTSYAPAGTGEYTVLPVAKSLDVVNYVHEQPDRIGFYESIASLLAADAIFIAGSNDPNYTASKIFQYIQAEKPFFALFNSQSSAVRILKECCGIDALTIDSSFSETTERLENILTDILYQRSVKPIINNEIFRQYRADTLTEKQTQLFDLILSGK